MKSNVSLCLMTTTKEKWCEFFCFLLEIWNRWGCCQDRLGLHEWYVDDIECYSGTAVSAFEIEDTCGLTGTKVKLVLPGYNRIINLQEIEVWGYPDEAQSIENSLEKHSKL